MGRRAGEGRSGTLVDMYAATATAGIAVLGNGRSSNVGWFAVCLLTGWCVLAVGDRAAAVVFAFDHGLVRRLG